MSTEPQFPQWTTPYRAGPAPTPAWVHRRNAKPAPFRLRELGGLLGVAFAVDLALWNGEWFGSGGVGAAILLSAVPVIALAVAKKTRRTARLFVIAALLLGCVVRSVMAPNAGAILSGLALVFAFVIALRMRRTYVPELLFSAFSSIDRLPSRIGAAFAGVQRACSKTRMGRFSALPVVVPLGIAAAFLGVFALANPVVEHAVTTAWGALTRVVGFPHPLRIGLWLATLVVVPVLLRPACHKTLAVDAAVVTGEATSTNVQIARNTLVLCNLMFAGYNVLDVACLWAGAPPKGVTTQIYAHQGAAWLTVALAMLTFVVGYLFKGALAHDPKAKLSRALAYAWMGQGLVLAFGTYRRIAMHISWSGLSDLRIVGILGTTLVIFGMALVLVKLLRVRSFGWLVRRQLDAFATTFVLYALFPTHLVSARVNVARIQQGEYRPVLHMFRQASETESATALLPLLHHEDARVRQGTAALLSQKHAELARVVGQETSFRQRDLSERRTLDALSVAQPDIEAALRGVTAKNARAALYDLSNAANEGASLEELLTIPAAAYRDGTDSSETNAR